VAILPDEIHLGDRGVPQAGRRLRLALKAGHVAGFCEGLSEHFEGDAAIERNLPGLIDDSHSACAQPPLDAEVANLHACFEGTAGDEGSVGHGGNSIHVDTARRAVPGCRMTNDEGRMTKEARIPNE
jgi:hypothetical protein